MSEQVKFEAGQVWEYGLGYDIGSGKHLATHARLIRPAPKPGQRWRNGEVEIQIVDADGRLVAESWENGCVVYGRPTTDVVGIARWLLDNGYELVEERKPIAADLRVGSRIRAEEFRSTGRVAKSNDGVSIAWATDGHLEEFARWYSADDVSGHLADSTWTILPDAYTDAPGHMVAGLDLAKRPSETASVSSLKVYDTRKLDGAVVKTSHGYVKMKIGEGVCPEARLATGELVELHPDEWGAILGGEVKPVEPDVRPLAALAELVASIYASPTREQARRYVDAAVRSLRGERFAAAMRAALVELVSDDCIRGPSPIAISATIVGLRAWEQRRGEVAPGRRALTDAQFEACADAAGNAAELVAAGVRLDWISTDECPNIGPVYERARAQ